MIQILKGAQDALAKVNSVTEKTLGEIRMYTEQCIQDLKEDTDTCKQELDEHFRKSAESNYEQSCEDLQRRLIEHYNDTSSNVPLSSLDQCFDKRISDIYATSKIHQIYIKKDGKRTPTQKVSFYKEIFYINDNLNRRIYVQGEPGSGKTTFAAMLVHDWARGNQPLSATASVNKAFDDVLTLQKFKFLFFISLRDSRGQTDVTQMIKEQLIDKKYSEEKREVVYKQLLHIIETEICLVVRDGLDEWVAPDGCYLAEPSMAGFPNDKCTVLTTSRPWKLVDERIKNSQIDSLLEIEGIINPETFIETILRCIISEKKDLEQTVREFQKFITNHNLEFLSNSPMLYTLVILTWVNTMKEQGHVQESSLCALYTTLLESLCKKANKTIGYFNESNIPPLKGFSRTNFLQPNIKNIDAISKAAFHLLFLVEKETSIVFNDNILSSYVTLPEKEFSLTAGLISKRKTKTSSNASISFIHKSMQEFLAAYHIARNIYLIDDVISGYLTRHDDAYLDISQVFIFLCGLDTTAANKLSDIMDELPVADGSQSSNETNETESPYHSRKIAFQKLILAGYREAVANENYNILLKLSHFYISKFDEIKDVEDLQIIWTMNKSNAMSLYGESSSESSQSVSDIEFDLSSCQQLKVLRLEGNVIWMKDSASMATSGFSVRFVLNGTDPAQCTVPPPVLPSIKDILLDKITCSSTLLHSLFSTLITIGHQIECEITECKIRSSCETEVSELPIVADVAIVRNIHNILSLTNIQSSGLGLWEAFHGLNIKMLLLNVWVGETLIAQDESFSKLLSSFTQLEELYLGASDDNLGLWKAINGLNIKSLDLSVGAKELSVHHVESLSQSLSSLTQLEELNINTDNAEPGLWEVIYGLNIKSLGLIGGVQTLSKNHKELLSKSLTSQKQLEQLSITVDNYSPVLWKAIYGLNITRLSLISGAEDLTVKRIKSLSKSLTSLTQLEQLNITFDYNNPGMCGALKGLNIKSLSLSGKKNGLRDPFYGLNIKSLGLRSGEKGSTNTHAESLSESLTSITQLEELSVDNSPGQLEKVKCLDIKSRNRKDTDEDMFGFKFGSHIKNRSVAEKGVTVTHIEYLSESLTSLTQLQKLSIEVNNNDNPALWKALNGLNIKNLSLRDERKDCTVNDKEYYASLSETLTSFTQLERLSITLNNDSSALWNALRGLNTKRLIVNGCLGGLEIMHTESMSQSLASLRNLESLTIELIKDSPGLWEALNGLTIKRLRLNYSFGGLQVIHVESMLHSLLSLKELNMLGIGLNNDSLRLWEALRGLHINILCLNLINGLTGLEVQNISISQSLSSLTNLDLLKIEAKFDSPDLWEALRGLNIKSLHIGTELGCFKINYLSSFLTSLSSLKQLEHISINLMNDLPGLWEVLFGLNIKSMKMYLGWLNGCLKQSPATQTTLSITMDYFKSDLVEVPHRLNVKSLSLRLSEEWEGLNAYQISTLTKLFPSLTALETLSITSDMDSTELWESLRGLNIKSLTLRGWQGRLKVEYAALCSQSLATLTQLETLNINMDYDMPGLLEALRGLNIKSLTLHMNQESSLSKSLGSLTQLDRLTMYVNTYSDVHLIKSLKYLNVSCERLSPRELRRLLNKLLNHMHSIQCILDFGCCVGTEKYLTIIQELDSLTHVEVILFRSYERSCDTHMENMENRISMELLINRVTDSASTTPVSQQDKRRCCVQ